MKKIYIVKLYEIDGLTPLAILGTYSSKKEAIKHINWANNKTGPYSKDPFEAKLLEYDIESKFKKDYL